MIIEKGINPNCSEIVYRFKEEYLHNLPISILEKSNSMGTPEFSQMLPTKNTICLYYYQVGGEDLLAWLESNKIEYDVQHFTEDSPNWVRIKPTKEESKLPHKGGSGPFYRRIPYREE